MRYHGANVTDVGNYIADPRWVMEQKLDGIRCIVSCDLAGQVTFTGHAGNPLRSGVKHHEAIAADLAIPGLTVDGELMADGTLWLFDILTVAGHRVTGPFAERRAVLEVLMECGPSFDVVRIVPTARTADEKQALWDQVVASGGEGVVVKRLAGLYSTGRTRDVLKIKITKTIDVVVIGYGSGTDSAVLGLNLDGLLVPVGKCSLIGKARPVIGDVIEVEYLYVVKSTAPKLYQARMHRIRDDKSPAECQWDQLDGATTSKDVVAGRTM